MRRGAALFAALLAILVMVSLAAGPVQAQQAAPLLPEGPWLRIETDGFVFLGNVTEERLRGLAEDLEKLRHAFLSLVGSDAVTLEGSTPTYIYALEDSPWSRSITGGLVFVAREHRNYAVVYVHPRTSSSSVLYREYVHQILDNTASQYPLWLRQGLVEIFGMSRIWSERHSLYLGPPSSLAMMVRPAEFWPISRLLAVEQAPDLNRPDGSVFRYESWALTHYLLFGNEKTGRRLLDFLARLRAGDPPEEAFHDVLGPLFPEDPRATLRAYLERKTLGVEIRLRDERSEEDRAKLEPLEPRVGVGAMFTLDPMPDLELTVRPMDRVEVLFRLGDLLLEAVPEQHDRAARFLRRAVELDPDHGSAHLGLAVLAQRSDDPETTILQCEKALEHLPADAKWERARANLLLGSVLLDSLGRRRPGNEDDRARLARARNALRRATELNPKDPQAWTELVIAYGLEPKPLPEEMKVLEEAMERFPNRTDLVSNAVLAHGRRGDRETAEALFGRLEEMGADEPTLTRAREVLLRLAFYEADRLIYQEHHDDAIGLFARIQSQTTDPRLRQQVTDRITLLERAEEYNRFIDRLLESQERMAHGDLAGAQALLDELRETARPGEQTEVVEALAERLAGLQSEPDAAGRPR
jgi:tetratricopeptide (TPR) repeat protein